MGRILTDAELTTLFEEAPGSPAARTTDAVSAYNFRRPDRVTKEQIRALHLLHERFARNATTTLAAYLRTVTELSVLSVEQFSYSEFLMALPDPTAFYAVSIKPFDALAALELNPSVAFTIVDRMLGGSGQTGTPDRALTEIEQNVVDSIVRLILEHLTETWASVASAEFGIQGRETRPQMLQVANRNDVVILLAFDLKIGDVRGMLHFCVPASVIEATGSTFVQGWQSVRREPSATEHQWLSDNLGRVPMPVTAVLEAKCPARELLRMQPGDVISLGIPATQPIDVKVGASVKFTGSPTSVDGRVAIRVDEACGKPAKAKAEKVAA